MGDLRDRYVKKAKRLVLDKFPEMTGVEPSLSKKRAQHKGLGHNAGCRGNSGNPGHYVLTFERDVSLPGGGNLKRLVRVTMDDSGEVVKLTSSK